MPNAVKTGKPGHQDAGTLRVLVVHPRRVERVRLIRPLRTQFGRNVQVFEAAVRAEAVEHLARQPIDVALVGARVDGGGLGLVSTVAEAYPQTATILVADADSPSLAAGAAEAPGVETIVAGKIDAESLARTVASAVRQVRLLLDYRQTVRRMEETHAELDLFIRALSHDMNANFMIMEHSFSQLERCLGSQCPGQSGLLELAAHVRACMTESKRFLNDLIDLGRTGSVEMDPEAADTGSIVDEVLFEQRALLEERNVEVQVLGPLPRLWCNRRRLKQIVTNLVRNALRHGLDGNRPRLTIDSPDLGERNRTTAALRIGDNGRGIPPAWRDKIFEPGCRLPGTHAEGSGMGLAIVKKIVVHYGGNVRAESSPDGGAVFVVELPSIGHALTCAADRQSEPAGNGFKPDRRLGHDTPHSDPQLHPHQGFVRQIEPGRPRS